MAAAEVTTNFMTQPGSMCQVQINADPANSLDWDKPMSELHSVGQATTMPCVQQAFANGMTAGNPGLRQIRFAAPATRRCNGLRQAGRLKQTSAAPRRLHTCKLPASNTWAANPAQPAKVLTFT